MPATEWGWEVSREELVSWIVAETADARIVNKPGLVVVHPSKRGPSSSLVGAMKQHFPAEGKVYLVHRLDRETSGVVVFARHAAAASRLQTAIEHRRVAKTYFAILAGELDGRVVVDRPIGPAVGAEIAARRAVVDGPEGLPAVTEFVPLAQGGGSTLARVHPRTGRQHQIRVHAAHLGHPVVGDKLYGGDPSLFLEFISQGFTPRLSAVLPLPRHALHCAEMRFDEGEVFRAPLAPDLVAYAAARGWPVPDLGAPTGVVP